MLNKEEIQRYSRHISLSEVGIEGQEKLKSASVLVIGAGGLGCPCLQYLSAAGIGTIGIVDFDAVDLSNLQRQILYTTQDIGSNKAEAAAARLTLSNPNTLFNTYTAALSKDNALAIIAQYDIVVDGSDNFSTRYLVNDACIILNKPLVFGSIFKFDGQVSVLNYTNAQGQRGPTYRCLFPEPPADGEMPSCSEIGVLGVLPGIIGSLQANEVLKLVLNIGEPLSGRLFTFDALSMESTVFTVEANAKNHNMIHLGNYDFSCEPTSLADSIDVKALKKLLDANTNDILLLDVREDYEVELCSLKHALHIPMNSIPQHLNTLPKNKNIVVYCHHGMRSASIVHFLNANGFEKVSNLEGGIHAWAKEIDNSVSIY